MKKLLLGLMLAAIPLVGCGTGGDEDSMGEAQTFISADGLTLTGQYDVASPHAEAGMDEGQVSMEDESASVSASSAACWVTLQYCRNSSGQFRCTQNGHCDPEQFTRNCLALYRKTC
ncbi:MAG: hypothetical protein EOO71_00985 [Myxococcaceae bacterium]|nr:MAG: hypothetical protein EOO71_00985 [Myxococcaceae bacterium]